MDIWFKAGISKPQRDRRWHRSKFCWNERQSVMSDRLTGTSNGGATTHAFGVKVQGPDAYGRDRGRDILALSGYPGSFLVLCGQKFNQHGPNDPNYTFNPPTPAEMTELGLEILKRRSKKARKPFAVVIEVESTDNMPNNNNASGTLRALKRADDLVGGARRFLKHRDRKTLIITAADSDGSGIQLLNLTFEDPIPNAPTIGVNSFFNEMGEVEDFRVATDGIEGANTRAFLD